jgi:hypothetical protein
MRIILMHIRVGMHCMYHTTYDEGLLTPFARYELGGFGMIGTRRNEGDVMIQCCAWYCMIHVYGYGVMYLASVVQINM